MTAPTTLLTSAGARKLAPWRLTLVTVSAAAVALPLLRPTGPGNTGVVDLALIGAMITAAMWASARSHVLRAPYAIPVLVSVVAGALAAVVDVSDTGAARNSLVALAQDVFVFGWAAAITTVGQDRHLLDAFCRAWAYSATAWAALLVGAELLGLNWLAGIQSGDGLRASLTLGDPNLAADYFICGLFVMRAARRPRHNGRRFLACALVVVATLLTLSNGGLLALVVATVAGALFALARRRGVLVAAAAGAALAIGATATVSVVDVPALVTQAEQVSPLARDSIGREAESGGSRSTLVREGLRLWFSGDVVVGAGPSNTESMLRARQAPYVKEAHNDFLAALLERGALGAIGLLLLAVAVAVRVRRICAAVDPPFHDVVPRPELLAAAVLAVAVSALFYEVLHFRHVWALFGLIAALELARRPPRTGRGFGRHGR